MAATNTTMTTTTELDLLIVGAGPSGFMLAAWAAPYSINFRIIDNKDDRVRAGHADGIQARTLELFDSFGLVDLILKDASVINKICSWNPDPSFSDSIIRTSRARGQADGLSWYQQMALSQEKLEESLLEYLRTEHDVTVERSTRPVSLDLKDSTINNPDTHPIHLTLARLTDGEDRSTVKCRYVVGCDGARSWVCSQLRRPIEGESNNRHFGVMDIVPLTDFPDIRQSCVIHSSAGSVMTAPHGIGRLVRMYLQLGETKEGEYFGRKSVTAESILGKAQAPFEPYQLDLRICGWQSVYRIGQRVAPRFSHKDRIFLCGDAVHTHSPTMGQGMNVSMQDAYNVGWKLGAVLEGSAKPEMLATYDAERRPVALELIELHRRMSDFYSTGQVS